MADVCELTKFTASGKVLRLVMDIAAALERYKIAMEGPEGVRLRKLNRIRTIRGTTAIEGNTLTEAQVTGDAAPFVEFMLTVVLRTIKAKGVPKSAAGGKKSGKKTEDRILDLLARNPKLTFAGMVAAIGISRSAIQKHVEHLKDAQRLRRVDPDKGGRWSVCAAKPLCRGRERV